MRYAATKRDPAYNMHVCEACFDKFIEDGAATKTADGKALATIDRQLDDAVASKSVTHELLAEYELAALRAGFMAGFNMADSIWAGITSI